MFQLYGCDHFSRIINKWHFIDVIYIVMIDEFPTLSTINFPWLKVEEIAVEKQL